NEYLRMSRQKRRSACTSLAKSLKGNFELIDSDEGTDLLPAFRHMKSGLSFKFVPSGQFTMGLSESEEKAARRIHEPVPAKFERMRPLTVVEVKGFLITVTPVLTREYVKTVPMNNYDYPDLPAHVTHEEASSFARQLGCRLPREAEWEYACRATTNTLFVWGNKLLPDKELETWIASEFSEGWERKLSCNRFGLYGLFDGEWCEDQFRETYDPSEAPRK